MPRVNHDLTKVLTKKYINKWVALNATQTKVVASNKDMLKVIKEADKKGYENAILTFVPKKYGIFVL